ncbi:MAG: hypothetical protein UT33_C0008G0049 [Candidatus Peregrinibacteria bacterium GW2011_GWC2_39_14]|nr:MAG: hypothetical protein US92_C0004G0049 [Candidatus Peregrinibacteria bacterium GW2011_GWA2_38_36]KKR06733.1 MAG: hypothetical protein UT33_C0008G0049 [Candidatus Peregrinibacteria bacterium GW2011_GWC2_39_14]
MKIDISKFGTTLISRPSGKEAFLAFKSNLVNIVKSETIELDFEKISVLAPAWADEFITPLVRIYGKKVLFLNTENPSVQATLNILKKSKES